MLDLQQLILGCGLPLAVAAILTLLVRLLVPLGGRSAALALVVPLAFLGVHIGMNQEAPWVTAARPLAAINTPVWSVALAILVILPTIMLTVPVARWWSRVIGAVLLVAAVAVIVLAQHHGIASNRALPAADLARLVLIAGLSVLVGIKLMAIGAAMLPPLIGALAMAAVAGGVAVSCMLTTSHVAGALAVGLLGVLLGVASCSWLRREEAPASTAAAIAIPAASILGSLLLAQHLQSSHPIGWPAWLGFALALPVAALGRLLPGPVASFVASGVLALVMVGAAIAYVAVYNQPPPDPYGY